MQSFRARFVLLVAFVAVVPLAVVGAWITRTAARSAEDLLRARLHEALEQASVGLVERWSRHRSRLLDLAGQAELRQALATPASDQAGEPPAAVMQAVERIGTPFSSIDVRDESGRAVWTLETSEMARRFPAPGIQLRAAVHLSPLGRAVGSLDTTLPVAALVSDRGPTPGGVGAIVGVFDSRNGAPLVPLPFDRPQEVGRPFEWGGDRWIAVTRPLAEPALTLVGAAPLTAFERPLRDAARTSLWILAIVGLAGLAVATVLTARMTGSLGRLAGAAEAVAAGDLDRRVEERGADEIGRVARAFNGMTASLRRTLQALADERALARVGEFAASLAHEIRNPLTAIRVDLQVVQEGLAHGSKTRKPLDRALASIERLDRTVGGALLATRAARTDRAAVDLVAPIEAAIDAARKTASRPLDIPLDVQGSRPLPVSGHSAALEQLFLNLLLNAVEAVRHGGDVRVIIERRTVDVVVRVVDTGIGLTPDQARQAFEPLFTTREGGTGLGLTIAARLARAHDASIELTGAPGKGATATVILPLAVQG